MNDINKVKHVGIITSNPSHFNHVVRQLQDINPDVMFHHVFDFSCSRNRNFDKLIAYNSAMWSKALDQDFLYIRQRYKTILKEEIPFVEDIHEPFVLFPDGLQFFFLPGSKEPASEKYTVTESKPKVIFDDSFYEKKNGEMLMPNIYINGSIFVGKAEEVVLPHLRAKTKELSTDPVKRMEQLVSMWNGFQDAPISSENIRKLQDIKEMAESTLTDHPELFKGQKHRAYDYNRDLLDLKIDINLTFPNI